jgi:hypothetical protein
MPLIIFLPGIIKPIKFTTPLRQEKLKPLPLFNTAFKAFPIPTEKLTEVQPSGYNL